jgi:uncharacterized Zn finger protein (UPF0148 family)
MEYLQHDEYLCDDENCKEAICQQRVTHNVETCKNSECIYCGMKKCPYGEPLHFHHDGCPSCYLKEYISSSNMSEISELPTAAIARMKSDESRISKEATYDSDEEVSVQYILSCISIGRTSIKNTRKHPYKDDYLLLLREKGYTVTREDHPSIYDGYIITYTISW